MKKIVSAIVLAAMLCTSTSAFARDYHQRWSHSHSNHRHHDRGVSTGEAVAIGLGALIVGAAIASSKNNRYERYEYRNDYRNEYRPRQYVCQAVVKYDYYGNPYVVGRNCWYQ